MNGGTITHFKFHDFNEATQYIDYQNLTWLANRVGRVEHLEVTNLSRMIETSRWAVCENLVARLINSSPSLLHLDLRNFSGESEDEDANSVGPKLMKAIIDKEITSLRYFNI